MSDLVALGEMMLLMAAPHGQRLRQAATMTVRPCGAQFNIAADFACLGGTARFLSALPANELGALARAVGRSYGVDMDWVAARADARMGLIFVEYGAGPRSHVHIYDRDGSAASKLQRNEIDWDGALAGARLAYLDGILPALNEDTMEAAFGYVEAARRAGASVCFDVNYRHSLWAGRDATAFYLRVLPHVDLLVMNRDFSLQVLSFVGSDDELMAHYADRFGCEVVCMTERGSPAPGIGTWRASAWAQGVVVHGQERTFPDVDRFGTGDAFFAGFLFEWMRSGDARAALDFGTSLCALAHTVEGDVAPFSAEEVAAFSSNQTSRLRR